MCRLSWLCCQCPMSSATHTKALYAKNVKNKALKPPNMFCAHTCDWWAAKWHWRQAIWYYNHSLRDLARKTGAHCHDPDCRHVIDTILDWPKLLITTMVWLLLANNMLLYHIVKNYMSTVATVFLLLDSDRHVVRCADDVLFMCDCVHLALGVTTSQSLQTNSFLSHC